MLSYIARRLLLMVPTLVGITFLVFMLVALAPGGIGAALSLGGGGEGAEAGQQRAIQEAYLEDRYGLNDPVVVQYVRWLGRVSPVKFGRPDQVDDVGEIRRRPKELKAPPLVGLYYGDTAELVEQREAEAVHADKPQAERRTIFLRAFNDYTNDRMRFTAAKTTLEQALVAYARAMDQPDWVDRDDKPILSKFRDAAGSFDATTPEGAEVVRLGEAAIRTFNTAAEQRGILGDAWASQPFPDRVWRVGPVPLKLGYVVHLATPDLGYAYSQQRPVGAMIADALPVTLLLNCIAFPIIYLIAVPTGLLAAARQGSWFDISSGAMFVALWSVPVVWAGVLAVGYLANDDYLGWFPVSGLRSAASGEMPFLPMWSDGEFIRGYVLDTLWHVCLPVACLVYGGFAVLSKQTRAAMLDNFNQDYVRTAKAKGVSSKDVLFRHVFRNSLLPLITMFASIFPSMLAGSVVIENIFSVPGMGTLVLQSIEMRDRELLLANALMIGAVNLLALLLADILYAMADPRITFD